MGTYTAAPRVSTETRSAVDSEKSEPTWRKLQIYRVLSGEDSAMGEATPNFQNGLTKFFPRPASVTPGRTSAVAAKLVTPAALATASTISAASSAPA